MIASSICCLNLSPPPGPSSLPSKTPQIFNWPNNKERSWRNKSTLGLSCIVIGLQLGDMVLAEGLQINLTIESKNEKPEMMRWSEKRNCTPWTHNSLETIVPENLPRPVARRRLESVGFGGATAPAVKDGIVKNSSTNGCFSM